MPPKHYRGYRRYDHDETLTELGLPQQIIRDLSSEEKARMVAIYHAWRIQTK